MVNQNTNQNTKKSIIENFAVSVQSSPTKKFLGVLHFALGIFALYVSIKCNNGFSAGSFVLACCCPQLYLIYIAATTGFGFCMKGKILNSNHYTYN
jgi:hypothetical protein|uniref:Uncharacterized protein n=1 Tax=viral metagenome TaxID=1070528 RepID=A0A6C0IYN6_9ZZZZ